MTETPTQGEAEASLIHQAADIVLSFFRLYTRPDYAGSEEISRELVAKGSVLTTGQAVGMYVPPVGNFLTSRPADEGVGLVRMTLDPGFWRSEPLQSHLEAHLERCVSERKAQEQRLKEAQELETATRALLDRLTEHRRAACAEGNGSRHDLAGLHDKHF